MKLKICVHTNICRWIFVTALFIIAKIWKQPRYPSVSEWINKLCYMWMMGYYSVLKRNELSSYEKTWRNLECILVRERSQSEKTTYHISPTVWHWVKRKNMETIKKINVDLRWGREMTYKWNTGYLWQWNYFAWHYCGYMSLYNFAMNLKVMFKK